jgi:hypothetical protein
VLVCGSLDNARDLRVASGADEDDAAPGVLNFVGKPPPVGCRPALRRTVD